MADWQNLVRLGPYSYTCGFCGRDVSSREGYHTGDGYSVARGHPVLFICPGCNRPSYFERPGFSSQTPAPLIGNRVETLPPNIEATYNEARECTKVSAYTACVLVCRKLLMHKAVEQGATSGQSFIEYVEYLADNGYVPPTDKAGSTISGGKATRPITKSFS